MLLVCMVVILVVGDDVCRSVWWFLLLWWWRFRYNCDGWRAVWLLFVETLVVVKTRVGGCIYQDRVGSGCGMMDCVVLEMVSVGCDAGSISSVLVVEVEMVLYCT